METQRTDLPETEVVNEEEGKFEESQAPVAEPALEQTPEENPVEVVTSVKEVVEEEIPVNSDETEESDDSDNSFEEEETAEEAFERNLLRSLTKPEILVKLQQFANPDNKFDYKEIEVLKQTYNTIRRNESAEKKKEFIAAGGLEENFIMPLEDESDGQIKALLAEFRVKRQAMMAEEERQKESNLLIKQHLIERLKTLTESQEDFNKRYNEFREIQRKWKEIKAVPHEHQRELWRNYQTYNERFYDLVKINNQFRDYDFKKNLEMKNTLCETVERLAKEPDIISAFHQLQKLHQQWREIGPVSKEFRDSVWDRFKASSSVINRRHQEHVDKLKAKEETNLAEKTAICEKIENIDYATLKTLRDWDKKTNEIIAMQTKWRSIGFATRRQNVKIFERFRAACDRYFEKRNAFNKTIKGVYDKNLELKKALIAKAEAIKDSVEWKETTKKFVELQHEWKKIGPVSRKYSDSVWKEFVAVCDYFFDRKNKETSQQKSEETDNLEAKRAIIQKIKDIDKNLEDEATLTLLRGYISEWNGIGFVPFKEKDKLNKEFHDETDKLFDRLKINERDRRIQQFRSTISELASAGKNKLYMERDKLTRVYERMKSELHTYENNIGFLSVSSKGGNGLLKEMDNKIARLKEDMEVIIKKIEAIDENLD